MRKGTLLAFLLLVAPAVASAQRDDSDWLDNCRNNRWNNERDNYCEVRVTGFRLGGRALGVDARENGGISVHAWDRDSVEVHERIQASGYSSGEAADIGRQVRVVVDNARIRADGRFGPRHASGVIGSGGRDLHASTVNGSIDLRKIQ